jgi:hypothetical protein
MVAGADDLAALGEMTKIERDVCTFGRHPRGR